MTEANAKQLTTSQSVRDKNSFEELTSKYCGICETWKKQSCEWLDSPQVKEINQCRLEFAQGFCHPLAKLYRSFPENMTKFKYETFGKYSFKERLFGLQGLTLLVAIFTFNRRKAQLGAINRLLYSTRNAAISYLFGGLIIAPEVYNPLIRSDI